MQIYLPRMNMNNSCKLVLLVAEQTCKALPYMKFKQALKQLFHDFLLYPLNKSITGSLFVIVKCNLLT